MDPCFCKESEWENTNKREEREEMYEFIKEKLRKGHIRPFKLPQIVLVVFVEKKDSKKIIVQDYRYWNEWTIKNNYLLSLIQTL